MNNLAHLTADHLDRLLEEATDKFRVLDNVELDVDLEVMGISAEKEQSIDEEFLKFSAFTQGLMANELWDKLDKPILGRRHVWSRRRLKMLGFIYSGKYTTDFMWLKYQVKAFLLSDRGQLCRADLVLDGYCSPGTQILKGFNTALLGDTKLGTRFLCKGVVKGLQPKHCLMKTQVGEKELCVSVIPQLIHSVRDGLESGIDVQKNRILGARSGLAKLSLI